MAFGNFKSLDEVAHAYQVSIRAATFVQPLPLAASEHLREDLQFAMENRSLVMSEAAICESIIAPILREVWKPYRDSLLLWSHVPFGIEEPLTGTPDYYIARRGALGLVKDQPFVLIIEAKKDDFETGWGQCLAAMIAAQKMNDSPRRTIHGCVTNGWMWQFGKLEQQQFTQELLSFGLRELPGLLAVWNFVLSQAKEQALAPAA